jgi:hypothetical protein
MSGGTFDYGQFRIADIVNAIEDAVYNNETAEHPYSEETIHLFKYGVKYLKAAQIYTHRIDWLLAGDDGEESFHERLASDLEEFNETNN